MKWRRRHWATLALGAVVVAGGALWMWLRPAPADTRFTGAYRLADGRLVLVSPREGSVLRYRMMSGESRALWPRGGDRYEAGPGWAEQAPVQLTVAFTKGSDRAPTRVSWTETGGATQRGERLDLSERVEIIDGDGLKLRAKLVTPPGPGPFPVVVFVHGSDEDSAVDGYYEPYLFAANGVAGLVFDKRGTGRSEGRYTQNFHILARDVAAVVRWARGRKEVDPQRVHLAGYSQGGWIAPLAASKVGGIKSILVGYGPMVPVVDEDRWSYVHDLRKNGFGDAEIARVDQVNAILGAIVDRGEDRWAELKSQLDAVRGERWFPAAAQSESMFGFVASSRLPLWVMRLYAWWALRPTNGEAFIDRHYDPVPTLAGLGVPSLWILGGEDSSMPTQWTIDKLDGLRQAGRPIEIRVFPEADHGIMRMEDDGKGKRRRAGIEPGYLPLEVEWVRRQSGLPTEAEVARQPP